MNMIRKSIQLEGWNEGGRAEVLIGLAGDGDAARALGVFPPRKPSLGRQVLDCASPLALSLNPRQPEAKRQRTGAVQNLPAKLRFMVRESSPNRNGGSALRARLWAALALLLATTPLLRAQSTNAPSRLDYQSFKLITDRNIFDPNRSPRTARSESRRPARTESFSLVGTLSYEKGTFAFFDGSSSEYRKVLKCTDAIAGHKITEIAPNRVKLEVNGKQIEMPVGVQMKRQDDDEWLLAAGTASSASASSATASREKNESSSGSSGGDESDILKKLMQKREQELNK